MNDWPLEEERQILADASYHSFKYFMKHCVGVVRNPEGRSGDGLKWSQAHDDFCDWLQTRILDWESTRKNGPSKRHYVLIDCMRGFMKTLIVTQGAQTWIHLRNPELASVLSSVTQDFSEKVADVIRQGWWGNKDDHCWFAWFYGRWADHDGGIWTRKNFTHRARMGHRKEASIECCSVETGVVGRHPEMVILDDPISPEKLRESGSWVKIAKAHVTSMFPVLLNDSLFIIVGTPYRDDDVITTQMRDHGVISVDGFPLPQEYEDFLRDTGRWSLYHIPALDAEGDATLASIWTKDAVEAFQDTDPSFFASQLLLRPGSGRQQILSGDDVREMIVDDYPRGIPVSIHLDTAIKDPEKIGQGDDNVILVAAHHPTTGEVWYVDADVSKDWTIDAFNAAFTTMLRKWKRMKRTRIIAITDDAVIGGKGNIAWRAHLEGLCREAGFYMPRFIPINRAGKRKATRIAEAASMWAADRVRIFRGMPHRKKLMAQMSRIGISQHDDMADAAADVFHEDIYRPALLNAKSHQPAPIRLPFDDVLKSNFSNTDARRAYDAHVPLDEMEPEEHW